MNTKPKPMSSSILHEDFGNFAQTFRLYEPLRNQKIVITGATGLLGSTMAKCLLALDEIRHLNLQIVCPVRNMEKAQSLYGKTKENIRFCTTEEARLEQADFFVHFAAPTASKYFVEHPTETFEAVVGQTIDWLKWSQEQELKGWLYVSSLEIYGSITDDSHPVTEDIQGYINPISTRSSYSLGKRAAECVCHAYAKQFNLPIKIARLTQTFGAGIEPTDNRVFAQFARSAVNHQDIILHTKATLSRPYCYTTDAVAGMLHVLLKGEAGEAYNIANESSYISVYNMAELIVKEFAPDIQVRIELQDNCGYAPSTKLRLSAQKAMDLGWKPTYNLTEMFGRLIAYLEEQKNTTDKHTDN